LYLLNIFFKSNDTDVTLIIWLKNCHLCFVFKSLIHEWYSKLILFDVCSKCNLLKVNDIKVNDYRIEVWKSVTVAKYCDKTHAAITSPWSTYSKLHVYTWYKFLQWYINIKLILFINIKISLSLFRSLPFFAKRGSI